jgi:hypothetical protein
MMHIFSVATAIDKTVTIPQHLLQKTIRSMPQATGVLRHCENKWRTIQHVQFLLECVEIYL